MSVLRTSKAFGGAIEIINMPVLADLFLSGTWICSEGGRTIRTETDELNTEYWILNLESSKPRIPGTPSPTPSTAVRLRPTNWIPWVSPALSRRSGRSCPVRKMGVSFWGWKTR
jgi:hypothetical protein